MLQDYIHIFLEGFMRVMEIFMIPRLINNLEETTSDQQVIWINEASNFGQYKNIEKVLFLAQKS